MVIPRKQINELGLREESSAEAILADGSLVELETFACFFEWFGETYETQVVANDGDFPLLGTMLLDRHRLNIDYEARLVELDFKVSTFQTTFCSTATSLSRRFLSLRLLALATLR